MVWLDEPEERKRILMDLHVMSNHKSPHIVQYYGSVIWNVSQFYLLLLLWRCLYSCVIALQNEVWVFMELMDTCLERLLKKLHGPIPEHIVCKLAVSVSSRYVVNRLDTC